MNGKCGRKESAAVSERISNVHFRLMSLFLRLRELFSPPQEKLLEAAIKPGEVVLDYGCGIGGYSLAAAELVGAKGKVYAVDIHPLALRTVERRVTSKGLRNVKTLRTDCAISLDGETVDVVLLYDVLHDLPVPELVLEELHRVLKPGGVLSLSDHHMKEEDIVTKVATRGLFRLAGRGARTYSFVRT